MAALKPHPAGPGAEGTPRDTHTTHPRQPHRHLRHPGPVTPVGGRLREQEGPGSTHTRGGMEPTTDVTPHQVPPRGGEGAENAPLMTPMSPWVFPAAGRGVGYSGALRERSPDPNPRAASPAQPRGTADTQGCSAAAPRTAPRRRRGASAARTGAPRPAPKRGAAAASPPPSPGTQPPGPAPLPPPRWGRDHRGGAAARSRSGVFPAPPTPNRAPAPCVRPSPRRQNPVTPPAGREGPEPPAGRPPRGRPRRTHRGVASPGARCVSPRFIPEERGGASPPLTASPGISLPPPPRPGTGPAPPPRGADSVLARLPPPPPRHAQLRIPVPLPGMHPVTGCGDPHPRGGAGILHEGIQGPPSEGVQGVPPSHRGCRDPPPIRGDRDALPRGVQGPPPPLGDGGMSPSGDAGPPLLRGV